MWYEITALLYLLIFRFLSDDITNRETETEVYIEVRRSVLVEDLLRHYHDIPDITSRHVTVMISGESAVDVDGVFRDVLTAFWDEVMDRKFDGERERVPVVYPNTTRDEFTTLGRILASGLKQVGFFPINFCKATVISELIGEEVAVDCLMMSFYNYLSDNETEVIRQAERMDVLGDDIQEELIDILSRFGIKQLPTAANLRDIVRRVAVSELLAKPAFAMEAIRNGAASSLPSTRCYEEKLAELTPSGKKVASIIAEPFGMSASQQAVFSFLLRYVRSLNAEMLGRFLRFSTGSSVVMVDIIQVDFNALTGLARRITSHTCNPCLHLPTTYSSYTDFRAEFNSILTGNQWTMDFL